MKKIILPGLIDPHVHLRTPGQEQKEDFYTGTCAALAGGYTTIFDMPNNKTPITTFEKLKEKISLAKSNTVCDIGFYFGSLGDNLNEFQKVEKLVFGLKLYLNKTTGNFLIDEKFFSRIFGTFSKTLPILFHAEEESLEQVLKFTERIPRKIHFCHISLQKELELIIQSKEMGMPVTCGVTPHHLFLTEKDEEILGPFGKMKPSLKTKKDVDFLWKNLKYIDVIESDHAPHTIEEKNHEPVPFGVPGLETTLPLLLTEVSKNKLTVEEVLRLCYENPAKIFGVKKDKDTKVEVELSEFEIKNENLFTKCKWSPFDGWKVKGKVRKVFIRNNKVFEDGKILAKKGSGRIINPKY